ncbi:PQQ-dependent sugar dehydrogenase [Aquimonas voraii]|uniref:Glucose/arabinose dehydrogenase, beta-propeller fold n=1 Tax=Aquimonas voraii TaxID=265719 RepID=A0A1G6UQR3_9GAMM|nr:PQQ-dependent sugar dehydrogenase [Aquimonas voraii]SDD43682.1 Glucose/arabinose dehydrogenase, beta-propeller fold [Aquimonas voraii]
MTRCVPLTLLFAPVLAFAQTVPNPPRFETYLSGFSSPIGLTHAGDGSGRLFVNQQGGALRVVRSGALLSTPYVSVSGTNPSLQCTYPGDSSPSTVGFTSGGERGLLGVAFHPEFVSNGRVFVSLTDANGDTLLMRYTAANPAADVLSAQDLATCTVVLRADQDFSNHNGGHIAFGPDGYLYFGLGDGGSGNDPCNRGQTLAPNSLSNSGDCAVDANFTANGGNPDSRALLGKFLRLDVDATTAVGSGELCGRPRTAHPAAYGIPSGNPGATGTLAAACDEVWSYGVRNPWRFSFDRETGDLWMGDVGQGAREEINLEPSGAGGRNYGWRCREGTIATPGASCSGAPVVAFTEPAFDYGRPNGACSVTGGFRYRGPVFAAQGQYFYGDYCSGDVWAAASSGGGGFAHPASALQNVEFGITSFGEGEDGELYLVKSGGSLLRLNGARTSPDFIFADGFETSQ